MILEHFPEVQRLSMADKWELADELWRELEASLAEHPADPAILEELNARMSHFQKHPETALSWDEVKQRLGTQK